MPITKSMGFERYAALEPVIANTKMMTNNCQFDLIFQRSLKFAIYSKSCTKLLNLWSCSKCA